MIEDIIVTGIVLYTVQLGEYDKRLVVLTKERGKITVFANGARRANSNLRAASQSYVMGKFTIAPSGDAYRLISVNVSEYFAELPYDMEKVCYASYFCELMSYSGGLARNIEQCLNDFNIPLRLEHTVVEIHGKERLEGVTIAKVDQNRKPILDTREYIPCDTLLLSVGLIPENELTREIGVEMNRVTSGPNVDDKLQTGVEGVFACGNVLHVHDLVDHVSAEAALAGENAAAYVLSGTTSEKTHRITLKAENGVRYTVPQTIDVENMRDSVTVRFRVADIYHDRSIAVYYGDKKVMSRKKRVLAPGEMENVVITTEMLKDMNKDSEIIVRVEE